MDDNDEDLKKLMDSQKMKINEAMN